MWRRGTARTGDLRRRRSTVSGSCPGVGVAMMIGRADRLLLDHLVGTGAGPGIVMPKAAAVFRLMVSLRRVSSSISNSAGLVALKILSTTRIHMDFH